MYSDQCVEKARRICRFCGEFFYSDFPRDHCGEVCRRASRRLAGDRKTKKVNGKTLLAQEYKRKLKEPGCCVCGYNKTTGCIDFHHINKDKGSNLSLLNSIKSIDEELWTHPTILVCRNCHGEIHMSEIDEWLYTGHIVAPLCESKTPAS